MFMRLSTIFLFSIFLTACGGDTASFFDKNAGEAEAESDTETSTEEVVKSVQLGILDGETFTAEKIKLEFDAIQAFETSKLSVYLIDEDGDRYTDSASVSFSSNCSSKGFANIISPANAANALVESVYTANGCVGSDTITATAFVNDKEISATTVIDVEAPVVNSLRYISAVPSSLGIKGFGQVEESTVEFKIMDREGRPVPNQSVSFSLNSAVGGITLYPTTAESDEQGNVKTVIHSGTTATNVRVTAVLDNNSAITATSEVLTISTGVADQNSLSLSASVFNPNAGNYDGTEVSINARAADHFNNPVPDGTKVYFTTEGGQIQPECEIKDGACSVKWNSSNPRPCYGRATVLATMVGEESFIDANGNGVLDADETFYDKAEAFRDDNEDGKYNALEEEFWDFNQNGRFDTADGKYNGVLCKAPENGEDNQCSTELKNIYARDSLSLVMASDESRMQVYIWDDSVSSYVESGTGGIAVPVTGTNVLLAISGALAPVDERYNCAPLHEEEVSSSLVSSGYITPSRGNLPNPDIPAGYQPMPAGTKMSVAIEEGELSPKSPERLLGSTSQSSPSYLSFTVFPKEDAAANSGGTVSVTVETSGEGDIASKKETYVLGLYYPVGGSKTVADKALADAEAAAEEEAATESGSTNNDDNSSYNQVPNSIQFVSASPSRIGIKGFGANESSKLTFMLLDQKGNSMPGETISFSLNTSVGGIELSTSSIETDASGVAFVYVNSGLVASNVRVTAILDSNPTIKTQSDDLVISTGVADQNSFTLYADILNPEGLNWNNEEVTVSVIASDHFNNPVPDGSSIYFMAEGGQIEPSCSTASGSCSVTWRSSDPRPDDNRVSILATMLGEESFNDLNGNGIKDASDTFEDKGEAYLDANENGQYDVGTEEFKDFNQNGIRDGADGKYNGVLCDAANCSSNKNIYVRDNLNLVLSGSNAVVKLFDPLTYNQITQIDASGSGTAEVLMQVSDVNGHPLPAETEIEYTDGKGASSIKVLSTNAPQAGYYNIILKGYTDSDDPYFYIKVTTPNGVESNISKRVIPHITQ